MNRYLVRTFRVTFWVTVLIFSFIYFGLKTYVNSYNVMNKNHIYMFDLQRISEEKAVFSVLNSKMDIDIKPKPKIDLRLSTLIPCEARFAYLIVDKSYKALFEN